MTDGILIERERIDSDSIPKDISQEDLWLYFTLSDADILEIQKCRGVDNMIGFAIFILQTCFDLVKLTQQIARDVNEVVLLFGDIGGVLLSEDISEQDIRSTIYSQVISKEQLQQKVDFCELLARPRDYNCLDFVETRENFSRQFSPYFLESFTFHSLKEEDELIDAVQLIKQCNDENKRKIPTSVPTNFISQSCSLRSPTPSAYGKADGANEKGRWHS